MDNILTIKEFSQLAGITVNTTYKYIRHGKIKTKKKIKNGKSILYVEKSELEKVLAYNINRIEPDNNQIKSDNNRIEPDNNRIKSDNILDNPQMEKLIKSTIEEIISNYSTSLIKPLEEQSIFIAGKLTSENQFLRQRLETILQENELLREQVKALPGPVELETKENTILLLQGELKNQEESQQKEKTELEAKLIQDKEKALTEIQELHQQEIDLVKSEAQKQREETEAQILQERAELEAKLKSEAEEAQRKKEEFEIKLLQDKAELQAKLKQEEEAKVRLKAEADKQKEELQARLKQEAEEKSKMLAQAEKEKVELEARLKAEAEENEKKISDAWKKELEEARKPWWKKLW